MSKGKHPLTSTKKIELLFAEIAKSLTSSLDHTKIIATIMKEIALLYNPDNWSLLILDPATSELYFAIAKGMDKNLSKKLRLKLGEGIAGHVAQTGQTLYVPDVSKDWRFSAKVDELSNFVTKSIIAIPVVHQGKILGVIELVNIQVEDFNNQDIATLKTIADFCAIALMNASSYANASKLADIDTLTGAYNRSSIDTFIQNHSKNNSNKYLIAAWINIDKFKMINEKYGYDVGDTVLKKTVSVLRHCHSGHNSIFRMGNDEFLILILNLHEKEISKLTDSLSEELANYSKEIYPAESFSFGITSGLENNYKEVISAAEKTYRK